MSRESTVSEKKTIQRCELCKAKLPYHFNDCYKASGRECIECHAMFPRHYPHCGMDVLEFNRWWIPMNQQNDILTLHLAMRDEAKAAGKPYEPKQPIEYRPNPKERVVDPAVGRRIVKALLLMSQNKDVLKRLATKKAILEEINNL